MVIHRKLLQFTLTLLLLPYLDNFAYCIALGLIFQTPAAEINTFTKNTIIAVTIQYATIDKSDKIAFMNEQGV